MILTIQHIDIEGPGCIQDLCAESGKELKLCELYKGDALPGGPAAYEAVIVLGGSMNVYEEDEYPFLCEENEFIKQVVKQNIPFLGICLGSQLLAKACNAAVTKAPEEEIGYSSIILTGAAEQDPLFEGMSLPLEVFQWHEDQFAVPDGAVELARSDVCPQAFRVGPRAYGLQFHFEVTPAMVCAWVEQYKGSYPRYNKEIWDDICLQAYMKEAYLTAVTRSILNNFYHIIDRTAG